MFKNCKNLTEIDMINFNLNKLDFSIFSFLRRKNPINELFSGCSKLNKIKLNININNYKSKINEDSNIFYGVPEN